MYIALPITVIYDNYYSVISYSYKIGYVTIEVLDSDFMTLRPDEDVTFKVVVIEVITLKSLSGTIDFEDYHNVKERFGI